MKVTVFITILFPFWLLSQNSDTSNLFARWIEIKPDSANHKIFNPKNEFDTISDLIQQIEKLVMKRELNIYTQSVKHNGQLEWMFIDYEEELAEFIKNKDDHSIQSPYFMRYGMSQDVPLTDEYGEPLTQLNDKGFEEFVYPPKEIFRLFVKDLESIKIKEVIELNQETQKYELKPSDIGFCLRVDEFEYERPKELFWVNIKELQAGLKLHNITNPTLENILAQEYKGFQYKQSSRDDGNINFFENKHPEVIYLNQDCSIEFPERNFGNHRTYVIKLDDSCEKTLLSFNADNNSFYYYGNPELPSEKYLNFNLDRVSKKQIAEITLKDKGVYNLIQRGCVTKRFFTIIIE